MLDPREKWINPADIFHEIYDERCFLDKAAIAAMSGFLVSWNNFNSPEDGAKKCYEIANAMLEERRRIHLNQQEKK